MNLSDLASLPNVSVIHVTALDPDAERCGECRAIIPSAEPDMINEHHLVSCGLHPRNLVEAIHSHVAYLNEARGYEAHLPATFDTVAADFRRRGCAALGESCPTSAEDERPRLIDTDPKIEPERNRCIALVWVVSETTEDGDIVRKLAVLDTMHMPNRGGYVTSLRPMTERQTPPFSPMRSFMMMEYLPIHTTPCGRYSAKGLANAAASAFAALRARKDDPAVRAIFGEVDGE